MNFEELINEILVRRAHPEDELEIAATLESMGWNDQLANERFGADDVFMLAEDIWLAIQSKVRYAPAAKIEKIGSLQYLGKVVRSFLRGSIFAWPMAISIAAMLTLRFSLWSYQNFSLQYATSISLGTVLSFMTIGGFTQAIARRGFLYIGQGQYQMARRISYYFVRVGIVTCLVVAVLLGVFSMIFRIYPVNMTIIMILYFLFLSGIWLSVTIMYILQKELAFTGLITAGIAVVYVLFWILKMDIILSQVIALTFVTIASILLARYYFLRAEQKMEKGIAPPLPRLSIIVYTVLPYFIYGFAYFAFLNIDRIIAWSANKSTNGGQYLAALNIDVSKIFTWFTDSAYMPYIIWFRGEYELGLDFALLVLILPMGLIEVVINEIMANLVADQKNFMGANAEAMNQIYSRFYRRRLILVTSFVVVDAVALYLAINFLAPLEVIKDLVFGNAVTYFVFMVAMMAYALLAVALMNSLILFSLSQPKMVYEPMCYGLAVNILVGFVLTRWLDYSLAVVGLLVGAAVFLFLTTRYVIKMLKNLDYYLYSAL